MHGFGYRDSELWVEELPLAAVAERFGTPCYVYSRGALAGRYAAFAEAFASHPSRVCYAVKANGNLAVLGTLAERGAGFDIVSGGELARVLKAGGQAARTVFSGACKLDAELLAALEAGVACFNVESEPELERLSALAREAGRTATVALRVNPDVEAGAHPHLSTGRREHKFGVDLDVAGALAARAAGLPGLRLSGLACHIGSFLLDLEPLARALDQLAGLAAALLRDGLPLRHLDAGGGLGVDTATQRAPTPAEYADVVKGSLSRLGLEIIVEPGRAIVAPAGVLLTRAVYLKEGHGRRFALVDAAMNDLIRPALYGAWHDILPLRRDADAAGVPVDVVGPVCETADFLGRDRRLAVESGDLLAVMDAGAYGFAMASNYNARPRCAEVMVSGQRARLVRRRESHEDLWRGESGFEDAAP